MYSRNGRYQFCYVHNPSLGSISSWKLSGLYVSPVITGHNVSACTVRLKKMWKIPSLYPWGRDGVGLKIFVIFETHHTVHIDAFFRVFKCGMYCWKIGAASAEWQRKTKLTFCVQGPAERTESSFLFPTVKESWRDEEQSMQQIVELRRWQCWLSSSTSRGRGVGPGVKMSNRRICTDL
jgi:hypothetical protein